MILYNLKRLFMRPIRSRHRIVIKITVILCAAVLTACASQSGKMAGQGAAMGTVVGGVGGLVTGLVFGGNVAESAARGAVWGASTGAVTGAIAGSQMDNAKKAQRDTKIERLKADLGEDAFNGLAALADCKHEVALGYAKTAAKLENKNYALAGLWIEVLAHADRREEEKARALFPDLVAKDPKINTESQAEEKMRKSLQRLMEIREEYNLPRVCS
jgi:hypothetical protein